jgi:hypothetical protein
MKSAARLFRNNKFLKAHRFGRFAELDGFDEVKPKVDGHYSSVAFSEINRSSFRKRRYHGTVRQEEIHR